MNTTIDVLIGHKTVRHFLKGKQMSREHLDAIIAALQQAPSWMNGQHYSVIAITDDVLKEKLVTLMPRNPHLASSSVVLLFCLDVRAQEESSELNGERFECAGNLDLLLNATMDMTLAMQNAVISAESLDYGTCCVGGVRYVAKDVVELLSMPKYTYPLCCLAIGHVDTVESDERIKPRFPKHTKVGFNQIAQMNEVEIRAYADVMERFSDTRETVLWHEKFADYYSENRTIQILDQLNKQGF